MNNIILAGRFTKDPEVRYTQGQNPVAIASFTLAVDRKFKKEGEPSADFPNCVAFGKLAEHIEKYYRKGMKTILRGRIQTRSYENREGNKVFVTEVVVEDMEFAESKAAQGGQNTQQSQGRAKKNYAPPADDPLAGFMDMPDDMMDDIFPS